MSLYYLLFTIYLAVFFYFIPRISFIKNSHLPAKLIIALFLLKILAGAFIGWMSQKYYPHGNDYWSLHSSGIEEYNSLLNNPRLFFRDIFSSAYNNSYGGFFNSYGSYWNDLKNGIILKFLAFCNILSRSNYYINSLFFDFIGFFGHIALYRIFIHIYKEKKWPVIIGCFLLPSTLYFSSGIHKDLIVFCMLGLYSYALYFSLQSKLTIKYVLVIFTSVIALLLVRNFLVVMLVPATIALVMSKKLKANPLTVFASTYLAGFLAIFLLQMVSPSFEPIKIITQKQKDFFELPTATTQIKTHVLQPNIRSLLENSPEAFNHALLRPYLWEHPTKFLIPLAFELFIYHVLFVIMFIRHQKNTWKPNPFVLFGLFVSVSLLLFIGYIVPNLGSIVRYRSLYLPFLITPVLCLINWKKINI